IEIFQIVGFCPASEVKITHRLSGVTETKPSAGPLVSCVGLLPSILIRQILLLPSRPCTYTTYLPSCVTTGVVFCAPLLVSCLRFVPSEFINQMSRLPASIDASTILPSGSHEIVLPPPE